MRTVSNGWLVCAWGIVLVATSVAGQPQPISATLLPACEGDDLPYSEIGYIVDTLVPEPSPDWQEIAGLPRSSRPELLTWDRVYLLALVHGRDGRKGLAEALDPRALAAKARQQGADDFTRFRKEFLAGRPGPMGAFRDPSRDYLELLRRLQTIDNAWRNVLLHESLVTLLKDLSQGDSKGLSQLDVDLVQAALVRARQGLSEAVGRFRDQVDGLKVTLGLSPRAAVIPDRRCVAAFGDVSQSVKELAVRSKISHSRKNSPRDLRTHGTGSPAIEACVSARR
jgi:hypothetical protein